MTEIEFIQVEINQIEICLQTSLKIDKICFFLSTYAVNFLMFTNAVCNGLVITTKGPVS